MAFSYTKWYTHLQHTWRHFSVWAVKISDSACRLFNQPSHIKDELNCDSQLNSLNSKMIPFQFFIYLFLLLFIFAFSLWGPRSTIYGLYSHFYCLQMLTTKAMKVLSKKEICQWHARKSRFFLETNYKLQNISTFLKCIIEFECITFKVFFSFCFLFLFLFLISWPPYKATSPGKKSQSG